MRPYHSQDGAALASVAADTFRETFGHLYSSEDLESHLTNYCSRAYFERALEESNAHIVLAWQGQQAIGYVQWGEVILPVASPEECSREIRRLYVRESHQAEGVGKKLFEHALCQCAAAPAIYLGVWEHNHKAQRFYTRYGFTHVGEHYFLVGNHADRDLIWCRQNR
jgi:diamine N-acetyltransferase